MADPRERQAIVDSLERARRELHDLVAAAGPADVRRRSNGTRWTNNQLLFHMVFGFMIVRRLLPLVHVMGRLPDGVSRAFASILSATTPGFHVVNYLGSCGGGLVFRGARLQRQMDRTIDALLRRLDRESTTAMLRTMHFPIDWDPYFRDVMSVRDVYLYGAQHFDHHRRQLTIRSGS